MCGGGRPGQIRQNTAGDILCLGAGHVRVRGLAQIDAEVDRPGLHLRKTGEPGIYDNTLSFAHAGLAIDGQYVCGSRFAYKHDLFELFARLGRIRAVIAEDTRHDVDLLSG